MKSSRSGFTGVEVLIVVAVLGVLGLWVAKPALFGGASKRAADSTKSTVALIAATDAQGGAAAASVVKIGEANASAPESPSRAFIASEVPVALSRLPAPDPIALLEAEKRRSAVMEGRVIEARSLYEVATKESAKLQKERDAALLARQQADTALEQAAAAEHARTVQMAVMVAIALALGIAWLWLKFNSVSPETLGKIAADVRAGVNPITAMGTYVNERLHSRVHRAAQLATDIDKKPTP